MITRELLARLTNPKVSRAVFPGLVIFITNPRELLATGMARVSVDADDAVDGGHYFALSQAQDVWSLLTPTFTHPLDGRSPIPSHLKRGTPHWKNGSTFYQDNQWWQIQNAALLNAASGDDTLDRNPNWLDDIRNALKNLGRKK